MDSSTQWTATIEDPTNENTIDRDLERRIRIYLAHRGVDARSIRVTVFAGDVTIRGTVRSFYHKQLCISCCRRVAGVLHLTDELEVLESRHDNRNSNRALEVDVR